MKRSFYKHAIALAAGLAMAVPTGALAQGTTTGLVDLTSLNLGSSGGLVSWSGTWTLDQTTFASVNGASDSGTSGASGASVSGTVSAQSTPANASSVAIVPLSGVPGIFGSALGQINSLPGNESANTSASTIFETTFTVTGDTQLTISAELSSILIAQAGPLSAVLSSADSFSVQLDGNLLLAWSDSIGAAPGQTTPADSESPVLTDTFTPGDGTHELFIELQTAQQVSAVPEPSTAILFAGTLLLFLPLRSGLRRFVRRTFAVLD